MPSVMKKRSKTFPSGVVITFNLCIDSSSSQRTLVTSKNPIAINKNYSVHESMERLIMWKRQKWLCTYHVIVLSCPRKILLGDISENWSNCWTVVQRKRESYRTGRQIQAGFSSFPIQFSMSLGVQQPTVLYNTIFHQ